jgi:hypothetical protein
MQPPEPMIVFITSSRYNDAKVGGVAGADVHCQALADADDSVEVLKGGKTFKAWISDGVSSPASSFSKSSGE